jgi:hypothetical protein
LHVSATFLRGPWPLHREFFSGVCHILHISCAVLELETRILCFRYVSENNCIWCFSLKFVFKTRLVFHLCIQRCLLLFVAFWIMIWCCFKSLTFERACFSETCLSRTFARYQRHDVYWFWIFFGWTLHGVCMVWTLAHAVLHSICFILHGLSVALEL